MIEDGNITPSGKKKYLAKNIGFLTIGQFGTKILNFLLVPLYTNILTTSEYGVYDLVHASVGILVPILTINIWEAVLRFSLEETIDKASVFSLGLKCVFGGGLILIGALIVNNVLNISMFFSKYTFYFIWLFFVQATTSILTSFARGINKVAETAISGVLCTIVIISSNILFLCVFRLGLKGYFLANIIGPTVQIAFLIWKIDGWDYFRFNVNRQIKREMVQYSLPTILNAISWWVNGWADRYAITWICGMSANGIYAVASKIPSILNVFQNIFNQAWALSTVKEFDEEDKNGFFSEIYNQYNCLLALLCSAIIMFDKILAKILYAKEFYLAWQYVPFLTISLIFGAISGYVGGIFLAMKRSDMFAKCSGTGAIMNIILNMITVPYWGALGAAVATTVSYWVIYLVSVFFLRRYMTIKLYLLRDNLSYMLLFLQSILLLMFQKGIIQELMFQAMLMIIIFLIYHKEINKVYFSVKLMCNRR